MSSLREDSRQKANMKNNWRGLRFGGWFSLEPAGEKKKFIIRRAKVHLLRVGADLFKVFLILLAVYFASMPFWPLAVPPVPAELKAKYPIPEFQPRGNGEAERMWQVLYPEMDDSSDSSSELTVTPLERLDGMLCAWEPKTNSLPPKVNLLLDEVIPRLHDWAAQCAKEDPPNKPILSLLDRDWLPYRAGRLALDADVIRQAMAGDREAALRSLEAQAQVYAYLTRGNRASDWTVGMARSRDLTSGIFAMYAFGLLDNETARRIGHIADGWIANRGSMVNTLSREKGKIRRLADVIWKSERDFHDFTGNMFHYWMPFRAEPLRLRNWGWAFGNSKRNWIAAADNWMDWEAIRSIIGSDQRELYPEQTIRSLTPQYSYGPRGRAGYKWATIAREMSMAWGYQMNFLAESHVLIGKALAAVGAHQNEKGILLGTLEDALAAMGPEYALNSPFVHNRPEYKRLDSGKPAETNTYAFTLTIWGDGGRCAKGGGVSWLIAKNPAFGEDPLRCWNWQNLWSGFALKSTEIRLLGTVDELDPALIPSDFAKLPFLGVPATLLGSDATKIEEAEKALKRFGWQDVPIPPQK